jgi:hypothetical protein
MTMTNPHVLDVRKRRLHDELARHREGKELRR